MKSINISFIIIYCLINFLYASAVGEFSYLNGDVSIYRKFKKLEAEVNMSVLNNDRIKTKKGSIAEIKTSDGGVIHLSELSSFKVSPQKKDQVLLELLAGSVRTKLKPLQGKKVFTIKTPVSVAGVRGTDWIQSSTGKTIVLSGKVEVQSVNDYQQGKPGVMVEKEQEVFVLDNGAISKPKVITKEQKKQMNRTFLLQTEVSKVKKEAVPLKRSRWYVVQKLGIANKKDSSKKYSQTLSSGEVLMLDSEVSTDIASRIFLNNLNKTDLHLAMRSRMKVLSNQKVELLHGKLKIHSNSALEVQVPYGLVRMTQSKIHLSIRSDKSALLEVLEGQVEIIQESGVENCSTGESKLISKKGLEKPKENHEAEKKKMRVIFDFRRDTKKDQKPKEIKESKVKPKKEENTQSDVGGSNGESSQTVHASDAKLVEGQADGEGEYRYESNNLMLLIIISLSILIIVGIVVWLLKRRTKEPGVIQNQNREDEFNLDGEDIYVHKGNYKQTDGVLETHKVTHITGDVEDGAIINAKHKVVIRGSLQAAIVKSTENLTVSGGINGQGKAIIEIAGELNAQYISEAFVRVKDKVNVVQSIHNAHVCSDNHIHVLNKNIVGGKVASLTQVRTKSLGSDFASSEIILGQPSEKIWKEEFEQSQELNFDVMDEDNLEANLIVEEEILSTEIKHSDRQIKIENPMQGPLKSYYEKSSDGTIKFHGFDPDKDDA